MRLGLVTPIVTRHPAERRRLDRGRRTRGAGAHRRRGRPARLPPPHLQRARRRSRRRRRRRAARATTIRSRRSASSPRTPTRIRFVTHVLVLGYHHPLAIAKRYGTLDRLCGGRLVLGVGVGTLDGGVRAARRAFADRGPRYEDALRALRAAFGRREPALRGHALSLRRTCVVDPCGVQARHPDLARRPHAALAAPRARARRRLGSVRPRPRAARRRMIGAARDSARMAGADAAVRARPADRPAARSDRRRPSARQLLERAGRYRDLGTTILNVRFATRQPRRTTWSSSKRSRPRWRRRSRR